MDQPRFTEILAPGVNVWTLPRRFSAADERLLDAVAAGPLFDRSAQLDTQHPDVSVLVRDVRHSLARDFLAADIEALVRAFGGLLNRRHVQATLSVVNQDACRKLHFDAVTLRLLCTYAGPGTEWVADEDAIRANLGRVDVDIDTANASVLRRPDAVRHCGAGDVIVLKGDVFPGNRGRGAIHRSPPVEATRQRRLVFKLDEHACGC